MKRMCVWAALAVALTGTEALALSEADAQRFAEVSSAFRKADMAIREAVATVGQKGTPGQKAVLRDSQRNWLGKGRDSAVANIQVGNLSDMQKHTLVIQARALKLEAFVRQVEAGAEPITLNGKARRISDEHGDGWGLCSEVSVKNATHSSCMVVAHKADLAQNEALTNTLDSAAAERQEIAVTGILASPEGFDPATVSVVAQQPETPSGPEQAQASPGAPQAQRQATP